jgi:hypothetical protein
MCDTLHLPPTLVLRLRVTSPQPSSFRQRIAAAQEGEECLSGLLPNNSPTLRHGAQLLVERAGGEGNGR